MRVEQSGRGWYRVVQGERGWKRVKEVGREPKRTDPELVNGSAIPRRTSTALFELSSPFQAEPFN